MLQGLNNHAIAVIGDGAITGGMAYEAINHAGFLKADKLIIILNDNQQVWFSDSFCFETLFVAVANSQMLGLFKTAFSHVA